MTLLQAFKSSYRLRSLWLTGIVALTLVNPAFASLEHKQHAQPARDNDILLFHSPFCPPCKRISPLVEEAAQNELAGLTLIPVLGGPDVELLYRAYAIAELEGVEREFNELLSNAVLRRRYDGPTTVLSILEQVGVDSASLDSRSAETKPLVQRYIALSDGYRISATPTIIVNGTHEINLRAINSADQLLAEIAKLLNS